MISSSRTEFKPKSLPSRGMPMCIKSKTTKSLLQLLLAIYFLLSNDGDYTRELFFTSRTITIADAVVAGGILLPHGDFALDPTFFPNGTLERDAAEEVARGARRAGRWLVELLQNQNLDRRQKSETRLGNIHVTDNDPLIVLITTPHGIKLDYDYGIYVSSRGSGSATIGGDCITDIRWNKIRNRNGVLRRSLNTSKDKSHPCQHKPYNVTLENIDMAPTYLAKDLLTHLEQEKRRPVSGIYSYNDEAPIPLNWGEIIPLLLLPNTYASTTGSLVQSLNNSILPLIWSFPYRRYNHSVDMVPELLQLGAEIMEWAQQRPEKIAIIVSGDLSHTHQSSGPYGYSNASGPYDDAIGRWAGGHEGGSAAGGSRHRWNPCQPDAAAALLDRAKALQPDAKSCGFTGYVMWHGMICSPSSVSSPSLQSNTREVAANIGNSMNKGMQTTYSSKVFVNRNVTYYGMISAIFEPNYAAVDMDYNPEIGVSYGKGDH